MFDRPFFGLNSREFECLRHLAEDESEISTIQLAARPVSHERRFAYSALPMTGEILPRHIIWRRRYDERQYARHLSQPELHQRLRDIFLNIFRVVPGPKLEFGPITDANAFWIEKFTHVLEELQLRFGPYPGGFSSDLLREENLLRFVSEISQKAAKRLSSISLQPGHVFIKFGKREHMESLYDTGTLRLQPANYFARTGHNGAVRDDELAFSGSAALSRDDVVKLVKNPEDVPRDAQEQRIDMTFKYRTDFWLYCMTNSVEPRLFVDFVADSCVIIRDREKFRAMLLEATASHLKGSLVREGSVAYQDPLFQPPAKLFMPLVKHFRYAYQDEYRFVWLPPSPVQEVANIDLQIGALKAFSELIIL
jgi:hypothetical protein